VNDAESITPAANPSSTSFMRLLIDRPTNTGSAPAAVMAPAARLARKPMATGLILRSATTSLRSPLPLLARKMQSN
jgi:hypothetical protein